MKRALATAVLALAIAAPSASAVTLVSPTGAPLPTLQRWANTAKVPMVRETFTVIPTGCPTLVGVTACTARDSGTIFLGYGMVKHDDREDARWALLHELGHQFDYLAMTDRMRAAFGRLIGDHRPWRTANEDPNTNPVNEKFAEAYSLCGWRPAWKDLGQFVNYAYSPTARQHRAVCGMIRRLRP